MRVLRNKIEISDIFHYAFFVENTTYGFNEYVSNIKARISTYCFLELYCSRYMVTATQYMLL